MTQKKMTIKQVNITESEFENMKFLATFDCYSHTFTKKYCEILVRKSEKPIKTGNIYTWTI